MARSGAELRRLAGHEDRVISAVFSPDGRQIVTASEDKSARVWDAESGAEMRRLAVQEREHVARPRVVMRSRGKMALV